MFSHLYLFNVASQDSLIQRKVEQFFKEVKQPLFAIKEGPSIGFLYSFLNCENSCLCLLQIINMLGIKSFTTLRYTDKIPLFVNSI